MVVEDLGLSTDLFTWLLFAMLLAMWAWSIRLCANWKKDGWIAVPMCLFGILWLGFGVDVVLRFLVLSYDSVAFGNQTYRLATRPSYVVNETLLVSSIYWLCVCLSFACTRVRKGPGVFEIVKRLTIERAIEPLNMITIMAVVSILANAFLPVPLSLATILTQAGALWPIPASLAWWNHFHAGQSRPRESMVRWFLLIPGALIPVFNPYREYVAVFIVVPCLAYLFTGKKARLSRVAVGITVFLLASTALITAYRQVKWLGGEVSDVLSIERLSEQPLNYQSVWAEVLRRFHGLDSVLLTVDLVPRVFAYSERNPFTEVVIQTFVPRALYPEKPQARRGMEFSRAIWAYDEGNRENVQEAAIAPSMMGDLYEAGGIFYVALGAVLWGLVLGMMEGWIRCLPNSHAGALTTLFAMQAFFSVERDFVFSMATTMQIVIILAVFMWALPLLPEARSTAAPGTEGKVGNAGRSPAA